MERVRIGITKKIIGVTVLSIALGGCASKYLKHKDEDKLKSIDEFENTVKIAPAEPPPEEKPAETPEAKVTEPAKAPAKPAVTKKTPKKPVAKKTKGKVKPEDLRRQPVLEDDVGFDGRRPVVDPFRVGEEVIHSVRYFKMEAGTLTFKVDPFVEVNGRRSYSFVTEIKSSRVFSKFYSVDDRVVTLMDYELLIPRVFSLHVKESGQLKEARSYFDFDKNKATYWEKKVTEKSGIEEKKQEWDILPYSQNVFSAIFYMRVFKWDLNKEYSFRVADDEENLIFKAKALRKETIDTEIGPRKAIVVKPEIMVKGAFKPVGDIFIWLSDDDRKLVLRIESKIKIGTLVSEVIKLNP